MPWLPKLARNLGLAVHHVIHAGKGGSDESSSKQTVRHIVEEEQLNATTTLRRTTIEEIEIKQAAE